MSIKLGTKKTLAAFMAVLMVMSCWVFTPLSFEAEAANGTYDVVINYKITNESGAEGNTYTGEGSITKDDSDTNKTGFSLYYKTNNGRGTQGEVYWDIGKDMTCGQASGTGATVTKATTKVTSKTTGVAKATLPGFPTKLFVVIDHNNFTNELEYEITSIVVNNTTIWAGTIHMQSQIYQYYGTLTGGSTCSWSSNDSGDAKCTTTTQNWIYPYVATSKTPTAATTPQNIGITPLGDKKDVSISTTTAQYYSTDQYGVRYEPTSYSVSGVTGLTTSGGTGGSAYKITAGTSTTASTSSTYQTATITMNWKNSNYSGTQHANTTTTIRVYNPRYKVTYNGNGGSLGTAYTYAYGNQTINAATSTATSTNVDGLTSEKLPIDGIREGYTFDGIWTLATGGTEVAASAKVTENITYYAHWTVNQYNAVFKGNKGTYPDTPYEYDIETVSTDFGTMPTAPTTVEEYDNGDYHYTFNNKWKDALGYVYAASSLPNMTTAGAVYWAQYDSTLVEADYTNVEKLQAEADRIKENSNYESIYTEASRSSLDAALNSVVTGKGRTQQDVVDSYATNIKEAIDNLEAEKYSVVFIDGRDNSVIKFIYPTVFGDTIIYPETPSISYDNNYHYTFREWVGTANETNLSTVEKNITIIAKFDKKNHDYTTESIESSCIKEGGTKYTCKDCGYTYTEYSGSKGDHNWSTEWTTDKAATCTAAGSKSHHCLNCDAKTDVTEIPALGHDYDGVEEYIIVEASCTGIGVGIKECNRCGYNNYITHNKSEHNMVPTVTAPTCTSQGYTTSTCSSCGKMVIDSFTDPIDHDYVKASSECVKPSCVSVGYDVSYCSKCGLQKYDIIDAAGHEWNSEKTTDIEPTCTTAGQESIHCSVCDTIQEETITVIPANGHSYDESKSEMLAPDTCTTVGIKSTPCIVDGCGYFKLEEIDDIKSHNLVDDTDNSQDANCTESGIAVKKCDNEDCDYTETTVTNPLGHDYSIKVDGESQDSTCCDVGYTTYKCSRCESTEKKYSDTLGEHDWSEWTTVQEVSTTQSGIKVRQCSVCELYQYEYTNPTGDHIWNDGEVTTPATCTEDGKKTYTCTVTYCPICGDTADALATKTEAIPATGHDWDNGTSHDADCTHGAYTTYSCKNGCGATYDVVKDGATALGHDWNDGEVTTPATCTEDGEKTFRCTRCTETKTEVIPKTGHTMDDGTSVDATCTSGAYTIYKCTNNGCDFTYNDYDATQPAIGHTWGNWTVAPNVNDATKVTISRTCTKDNTHVESYTVTVDNGSISTGDHDIKMTSNTPATCHSKGSMKFECTAHEDCGVTFTVETEMTAHTLTTDVVNADCETAGSITIKCTNEGCTYKVEQEIPALGHDYVKGTHVDADCTHSGYDIYTCSRCHDVKNVIAENVKSHTWKEVKNSNTADCTNGGTAKFECSVCHSTIELTTTALGHDWKQKEVIPGNCGTREVTRYECSRCHITKDVVTGDTTTGEHDFKFSKTVSATCTQAGYDEYVCSICRCTDKRNVTPALDHDWGNWTIIKYPSQTENGLQERYCQRCTKREEQEIVYGKFYLVTFYNYDGTRLMPPAYYEYGTAAVRPRFTPVRADEMGYTYTFKGWNFSDDRINFVDGQMAIIAQYDAHERVYDVTYNNYDATTLHTINDVLYTEISDAYSKLYAAPTKPGDTYYDYQFSGWSVSYNTVSGSAIATAMFKEVKKDPAPSTDTDQSKENLFTRIVNWLKQLFNKIFGR